MTPPEIYDRGRGPEIKGTRITVYDVLDYHKHGWAPERIAWQFNLPVPAIELAVRYIEEHRDEVWRDYEAILARHARGNPPEVEAKLAGARERLMKLKAELAAKSAGNGHVRPAD